MTRLTWNKVRTIRAYYATGNVSQQALADFYGVAQMTVSKIIRHETWKEGDRTSNRGTPDP